MDVKGRKVKLSIWVSASLLFTVCDRGRLADDSIVPG